MVAGFDRYYQITKCFRDEDLRADRQPEFTQVDIETSFLNETEITAIMEDLLRYVFKEAIDADLPNPFPRLTYDEAMHRYGSDKPDLRVTLELTEITDAVIMPGAVIERGAVVRRANVAENAHICAGAVVGEETGKIAVIGHNAVIPA